MSIDPAALPDDVAVFFSERHLATLSITRGDAPPHVSPVGVTYDQSEQLARIITWAGARKSTLIDAEGDNGLSVSVCSVDGARWITIEGVARTTTDPDRIRVAVDKYAERYRTPSEREDRVAIEISVTRIMGRA